MISKEEFQRLQIGDRLIGRRGIVALVRSVMRHDNDAVGCCVQYVADSGDLECLHWEWSWDKICRSQDDEGPSICFEFDCDEARVIKAP